MQLAVPNDGGTESGADEDVPEEEWVDDPLSEEELEALQAKFFDAVQEVEVSGLIQGEESEWGEHQALVDELRAAIHRDYDSTVLSGKFHWGPEGAPIRGENCEAKIHLKQGAEARAQKQIRLTGERWAAMKEIAEGWVANGRAESCSGNWRHPSFPIKKKDGKWRGVIDLKWLNSQCEEDSYPLPRIEDLLVKQAKASCFTVMDLKDAFHQMPVHPDSRRYTGTDSPIGMLQWRVLPMGWKNGVAFCQRNVETALRPVEDTTSGYIDDLLIGTVRKVEDDTVTMLRQHDADIRRTLDALLKAQLVASGPKCKFFVKEVEWCGNILCDGVRKPMPGKLNAIAKWELPPTVTALRSFLGFCNYYSTFVQGFANMAARLLDKLKVGRVDGKKGSTVKLVWSEEEKADFEALKKALTSSLSLQVINPEWPFVLRTDASGFAVGAVLEQVPRIKGMPTLADVQSAQTVPVAFMSRKLTTPQFKSWTTREKEAYAVVCALEKWAGWIGDNPVLILTDHKTLEAWATEIMEDPMGPSGRRARWHLTLSRFRLEVQYLPGKDNVVADGLSRWAYPASQAGPDVCWHGTKQDQEEMSKILAEEKAEEWAEEDGVLGVGMTELQEAILRGALVDFTQPSEIPFSEDAEWRGEVELSQDLWEANNLMMIGMMDEKVSPTFGIVSKSVEPGEVCVHALAQWAAKLSENSDKIPKTEGRVCKARGNGSCLFHSVLESNDPKIAFKLRQVLSRYVAADWDTKLPGVDMTVGALVLSSGMSREGYLAQVVLSSYWGGEIELFLLAVMRKQIIQVYLDAGPDWQQCRSYGVEGPVARLFYHDSHYDWIQLRSRFNTRIGPQFSRETMGRGETQEGESNPCDAHRDCRKGDKEGGVAEKSPPLRFQWSRTPGETQEQSGSRRMSSMKKHGWVTQDGQLTQKSMPPCVPPVGKPLKFQRSRRGQGRQGIRPDLHIMQEDWGPYYDESMWWQQWWLQIHGRTGADWPEGVHLWDGKMYHGNQLCVPEKLSGRVIRAHHATVGHVVGERLRKELNRRYRFAPEIWVNWLIAEVGRSCEVCQAHNYPSFQVKGPISYTPVCPELGVSVCIDLFMMPEINWRGEHYNCMMVCVDRLSGWMMVTPHDMKGLTAEVAARTMVERWWQPFGVPSIVTSDQGPQFAGAFWRTLCAQLGVLQTFAQAYHPQANGRAEVAGKTFKTWLRKISEEEKSCWVELIPHVLRKYHDMPGVSGLSPYEIVYGRQRPLAGLPYEVPRVSEDAVDFFHRMEALDAKVAKHLDEEHRTRCKSVNASRKHKPIYAMGSKVWFKRPASLSAGLHSVWEGPGVVLRRVGAGSYLISNRKGEEQAIHEDQIKPHVEDVYAGQPRELYFWKGGRYENRVNYGEKEVEAIKNHKWSTNGKLLFLTKWVDRNRETWEPVSSFVQRYSEEMVRYAHEHGIELNLTESLFPSERTSGRE
jgi:transposase InsO family protein